jgi:hypothetical protein
MESSGIFDAAQPHFGSAWRFVWNQMWTIWTGVQLPRSPLLPTPAEWRLIWTSSMNRNKSCLANAMPGVVPSFLAFPPPTTAPIQNKLGQFLLNPVIRNILGQVGRSVDIPFVMNTGRIFIANLAKGKLGGDKANLLGSLLVTQFQLAAMARGSMPEEDRRDFHLFIDEFQNFSTESFASILAEARKYRLCLVLSHQFLDQLVPSIRQAILGNVGTVVSFHIGHADAEEMAKAFGETISSRQLVDLSRHEVVARMLKHGETMAPFLGKTAPPMKVPTGRREAVVANSRNRFAKPREKVERCLSDWIGPSASTPDP